MLAACRVGRTGRAGRHGQAITFFIEDDAARLQAIADCIRRAGCDVPEWMLLLRRGRAKPIKSCITEKLAHEQRARAHKRQIIEHSKVCAQAYPLQPVFCPALISTCKPGWLFASTACGVWRREAADSGVLCRRSMGGKLGAPSQIKQHTRQNTTGMPRVNEGEKMPRLNIDLDICAALATYQLILLGRNVGRCNNADILYNA
jgi:superfamily II DNA/RNA helicase